MSVIFTFLYYKDTSSQELPKINSGVQTVFSYFGPGPETSSLADADRVERQLAQELYASDA